MADSNSWGRLTITEHHVDVNDALQMMLPCGAWVREWFRLSIPWLIPCAVLGVSVLYRVASQCLAVHSGIPGMDLDHRQRP